MIRLSLILFALASLLTACEETTTDPAYRHDVNDSMSQNKDINKTLDLKVTPEMLERLAPDQALTNHMESKKDISATVELDNNKPESRVGFSGEVFYDETSDDYLQAIDGGKINVEIKFK